MIDLSQNVYWQSAQTLSRILKDSAGVGPDDTQSILEEMAAGVLMMFPWRGKRE